MQPDQTNTEDEKLIDHLGGNRRKGKLPRGLTARRPKDKVIRGKQSLLN